MKLKIEKDGQLIDYFPNNFYSCKHRGPSRVVINNSTCCKNDASIKYTCALLRIDDLDCATCAVCQRYEEV